MRVVLSFAGEANIMASGVIKFFKARRYEALLGLLFVIHALLGIAAGVIAPGRMVVDGIDPVCYYSYLRSMFFDRDLDFGNEYRMLDKSGSLEEYALTPTGRRPNSFSIGPALALAPFYAVGHAAASMSHRMPDDGYSPPYQILCFLGLALYSLGSLILVFRWLRHFFPEGRACAAAAVMFFGSSAVYYAWPITLMPHAVGGFFVALFLLCAETGRGSERAGRWAILGFLTGLMALMRWQNIIFVLYLVPEAAETWRRGERISVLKYAGAGALGWLAAFWPQMAVWQTLYGQPFTVPQGAGFMLWARPAIGPLLFSTFNGLFTWTPLTLVGAAGLIWWMKDRNRRCLAVTLLAIFAAQVYVNSAVRDWHGSWGFGMRRFVESLPLFAAGLAALLSPVRNKNRLTLWGLALSIFLIWNYLFLVQHYFHLVAWHRPLTYHEMVGDKMHILISIERRRLVRTAELAEQTGVFSDVSKALALAFLIDPNHSDIYMTAGRICAERGDLDMAYRYYRKAQEISPEDSDLYNAFKELRGIRDHYYVYE